MRCEVIAPFSLLPVVIVLQPILVETVSSRVSAEARSSLHAAAIAARSASFVQQNRNGGFVEHVVADTAEERFTQFSETARPHHDQVDILLCCRLYDVFARRAAGASQPPVVNLVTTTPFQCCFYHSFISFFSSLISDLVLTVVIGCWG